jgi:acyl carrier protein
MSSQATSGEADTVLRQVLQDVLGLSADRVAAFTPATGLFGHLPELDSMAVAGLLTEVEDRLGIVIEDDEVDGEMLETYGALLAFVQAKRGD